MNYTLPGSSVCGILQARILEWAAISFPRGSSPLRDGNCIPCIGKSHHLATCEDLHQTYYVFYLSYYCLLLWNGGFTKAGIFIPFLSAVYPGLGIVSGM